MLTVIWILYNDDTGHFEYHKIPLDLVDEVEELPMSTFCRMEVTDNSDVIPFGNLNETKFENELELN